jgi:polyisoprenoid-binding protein YceI
MIGPTVGFTRTAFRAGTVLAATMLLAALAVAAGQPVKYTLDQASSLLRFNFEQAGASNTGRFGKYVADVVFSSDNLAASKIDVSIDVASLDTGDKERDDTLKGADLFDVAKFPKARFVSSKITMNGAGRYEATGKLTIRNVTKDFKLPITFQTKEEKGKQVGFMTGRVSLKRLEYGVGQGEWKSTEWVKDDVLVTFSLKLVPAS